MADQEAQNLKQLELRQKKRKMEAIIVEKPPIDKSTYPEDLLKDPKCFEQTMRDIPEETLALLYGK